METDGCSCKSHELSLFTRLASKLDSISELFCCSSHIQFIKEYFFFTSKISRSIVIQLYWRLKDCHLLKAPSRFQLSHLCTFQINRKNDDSAELTNIITFFSGINEKS